MQKETDTFLGFLKERGLKLTGQRESLLKAFLKSERHLSVEDLYNIARKRGRAIGYATVFRTLKLLCAAGIAEKVDLGDKIVRYEHKYGHLHHDHLVCVRCGRFIEAVDDEIEKLQKRLCERFGFSPRWHKLDIFGVCGACGKSQKAPKKGGTVA